MYGISQMSNKSIIYISNEMLLQLKIFWKIKMWYLYKIFRIQAIEDFLLMEIFFYEFKYFYK